MAFEDNIRNYSKEINTIEDFATAVRKTVGQYLGYTGNRGFINMIREIIQNSFDELQKESSPCDHVWIAYNEKNHEVYVRDNGRGIPFADMIRVFSRQHTSSNYNKKAGEFSSGRHGVGSKVTNAVSEYFIVESYILGEARTLTFRDGVPVGEPKEIPCNGYQGTIIRFKPSYEVMGEITTTFNEVLHLVKTLVPLLKIGAVIDFTGINYHGEEYNEHIINEDGIITFLINKTTSPLIKPVMYANVCDTMKAEIAFTYDSNDLMNADITGFSNFCPTIAGTHIEGFVEGLTKFFRDYMNKIYLGSKSKVAVVGNDIRCGLKAIVAVSHLEPIFTGQAKEILSNDDMLWYVRNLTIDYLTTWAKENPNDLQRLCKYYKDVAELRMKSDESKVKLSQKYEANKVTGLPRKFIKPTGKPSDKLELIIVEGDSAAGSIKNYRDNVRQGLFPIRGKITNAFAKTASEFLKNEEVGAILTIIGCGYGKNFDITKCKWDKIIIGADADPDGSHIRALFLKFMLLYCTPLIEAGKFYSLVPPLYGFKPKNSKKKLYFTQKLDYIKYILSLFSQQNKLEHISGSKYTQSEAIELMFRNMEYVDIMDSIVTTFAVNPYLLEDIVINRTSDMKTLSRIISKKYRFLSVEMMNNSIVIKGLLDDKYQTVILNEYLLSSIKPLEKFIDESPRDFLLNGERVTLYGLMKRFDMFVPRNSRFKGLGEMDGKELSECSVHPDSNRVLLRYSIEDVKREIEAIKAIETDKSVLLKDIKVTKFDID